MTRRRTTIATLAAIAAVWLRIGPAEADDRALAVVHGHAPAFVLSAVGDRQLTLRDFAREPLVINVFASWCPPCRRELPGIVAAARNARKSVAFLGVDEQEPQEIGTRFARSLDIPYPIGFDAGQFAASYGAGSLPVTIFIDASGTISAIHHGAISAAELKRRIAAIAAHE